MTLDLFAIVSVLNQQESELVVSARRNLLQYVAGSLSHLTDLHPHLLQLFRQLPTGAVERLVSAPETFRHLLMVESGEHQDGALRFLEAAIRVELCRAGMEDDLDGCHWSALGDICYDRDPQGNDLTLVAEQRRVHTLLVDGRSPSVRRMLTVSDGKTWQFDSLRYPTDEEYAAVCAKTTSALDLLRDLSPAFYSLIGVHVKTVLVKSDDGGYFTSSSSNAEIGRLAFFNAHLDNVSLAQIMTALVHEAIHSFLYCIEQSSPLTLLEPQQDKVTLTSPWTGGKLSLHSYLHAFFVWWGVARLWRTVSDPETEGISAAAAPIREKALRGFRGDRVLKDLEHHSDKIAPGLMAFLSSVVGQDTTPKVDVPWI